MRVLVLLLLAGCLNVGQSTPPTDLDIPVIGLVTEEWVAEGLPYPDRCDNEYPRLRVLRGHGTPFENICGRPAAQFPSDRGHLWGCFRRADGFRMKSERRPAMLVVSDLADPERQTRTLAHETCHWLDSCSGLYVWRQHEDQRVSNVLVRSRKRLER